MRQDDGSTTLRVRVRARPNYTRRCAKDGCPYLVARANVVLCQTHLNEATEAEREAARYSEAEGLSRPVDWLWGAAHLGAYYAGRGQVLALRQREAMWRPLMPLSHEWNDKRAFVAEWFGAVAEVVDAAASNPLACHAVAYAVLAVSRNIQEKNMRRLGGDTNVAKWMPSLGRVFAAALAMVKATKD